MGLALEAFNLEVQIAAPAGATHFKLSAGVSELDFDQETSLFKAVDSGILPYNNAPVAAMDLDLEITANSTLAVVQVLSIEFFQEVNGTMYPLQNGTYNAMTVVQTDQPA